MPEGGDDYAREIRSRRLDCGFEARNVVIDVVDHMGAVFRRYAKRMGRTPRNRAMVGALGGEDFATPRRCAGQDHASGRRVRSIFREYCPIGVRKESDQAFSQLHHPLGRTIHAITLRHLALYGLSDDRMIVAKHDRAPTTHEIQIPTTVNVPNMATGRALKKLRIARGKRFAAHVPVHPARNNSARSRSKLLIRRFCQNVHEKGLRLRK